jgi:predicted peroxiredoxin
MLGALCVAAGAMSAPLGPNLYIAGDGFTIEQALGDATTQRTPLDAPTWKLLVTGDQAQRLIAGRVSADTLAVLRKAQASGARIFVCSKDLKALGVTPQDLVRGVIAVRGYIGSRASAIAPWEWRLPRAPDRKSLSVCAQD